MLKINFQFSKENKQFYGILTNGEVFFCATKKEFSFQKIGAGGGGQQNKTKFNFFLIA